MTVYLSSFMIGDHVDRLLALAGGPGARMAVITNALDYISFEDQLAYCREAQDLDEYFAGFGFDPSLIDLRYYFGRREALRAMLLRHRIVWAVGGNAFLLRRAMRDSGFDLLIGELLEAGVIYAGWSAGACVAGDSLRAVGQMDATNVSASGYTTSDIIWEGLGLVPFTVLPHFQSEHPEASSAAAAAAWAEEREIPHRTLRDGDVLLAIGGSEPVLLPRHG